MIVVIIILIVVALAAVGLIFLLGFRLGGEHWQSELARVRLDAARAERQLHDLTREAFVSMAEAVDQRRQGH